MQPNSILMVSLAVYFQSKHVMSERGSSHKSPAECIHVLTTVDGSIVYYDSYTESVFLTYFPDGVWFSTGEYGTGYLLIGTNAFLLWSWFLLFFSLVSNVLWVRDNLLWVTDWGHVVHTAQAAPVMILPSCSPTDAAREVQKYSGPEPIEDAKVNPNLYDHIHMKLFRAQRNLYISGFSLFLWLLVKFMSIFIELEKNVLPLHTTVLLFTHP